MGETLDKVQRSRVLGEGLSAASRVAEVGEEKEGAGTPATAEGGPGLTGGVDMSEGTGGEVRED